MLFNSEVQCNSTKMHRFFRRLFTLWVTHKLGFGIYFHSLDIQLPILCPLPCLLTTVETIIYILWEWRRRRPTNYESLTIENCALILTVGFVLSFILLCFIWACSRYVIMNGRGGWSILVFFHFNLVWVSVKYSLRVFQWGSGGSTRPYWYKSDRVTSKMAEERKGAIS